MDGTILIADRRTMFREALGQAIERTEKWTVVADVGEAPLAVELCERLQPTIAVLNVGLLWSSGTDVLPQITSRVNAPSVVITSGRDRRLDVTRAFRGGARAFVVETAPLKELGEALETVAGGRTYLSPTVSSYLVDAVNIGFVEPMAGIEALTDRELNVLRLAAEGYSSKEIGANLGISPRTAETHRHNVMEKLDTHKIASLVRLAIREGLIDA